jgi:catechol 2,3-dioxygenase-like lactoylglutathione lyase family enzyme
MIRGISIASIPVRNQDAALKFYTEKLGFKVLADQPFTHKQRWIELLIPGAESKLALLTPEGQENRIGSFQPLTFWCDDVFATAKILNSKGVESAAEPESEAWGTMAIFKDIDSNQLVLSNKLGYGGRKEKFRLQFTCSVSGHEFTRAVNRAERVGLYHWEVRFRHAISPHRRFQVSVQILAVPTSEAQYESRGSHDGRPNLALCTLAFPDGDDSGHRG